MSDELDRLLGPAPRPLRRYRAGSFLFHRGDPVRRMHIVRQGTVHLLRHGAEGGPLVLQRAGPGSLLAEASLFSDRYHCDAVAVGPVAVETVACTEVRQRLAADAGLAAALAARLARELQAARQQAEILSLRTVAERLDAWLASGDGALPERGGWKRVAAEIGSSPEALYRELAKRRALSGAGYRNRRSGRGSPPGSG